MGRDHATPGHRRHLRAAEDGPVLGSAPSRETRETFAPRRICALPHRLTLVPPTPRGN